MSKRASLFRKNDIKRMLEAAKMAGVKVGSIEVQPGKIVLVPDHDGDPAEPTSNEWDSVK